MPQMTTQWDRVAASGISVPEHVVHRSFVSETVLLNIQTGYYHGMDEVGGRFFSKLSEEATVQSAADALAEEFEQPVERIREDMLRFCLELEERGLIELVSQPDAHQPGTLPG